MDGIVLINKEKGISSFGVVSKIRKIFNIKKVGHCGTLDPEAMGVLPIMIGNATKISKYLVEHDKEYVATLKLGIKTDSADGEGKILEKSNFTLDKKAEEFYKKQIMSFVGTYKQLPPMYSAIKVNGKKLYEYAREGKEISRKEREVEIYDIEILKIDYSENEIEFRVTCSKGTYIRTLCEDISNKIGTIGYMKKLIRTKIDKFCIDESVLISDLEKEKNKEQYIIGIEELFQENEKIILNDKKKELFLNGVRLTFDMLDGVYKVYNNEQFLGLGIVDNKLLKRDVIL